MTPHVCPKCHADAPAVFACHPCGRTGIVWSPADAAQQPMPQPYPWPGYMPPAVVPLVPDDSPPWRWAGPIWVVPTDPPAWPWGTITCTTDQIDGVDPEANGLDVRWSITPNGKVETRWQS